MSVSYEDFLAEAKNAGLLEKFSVSDLKLAQENPTAGMSILSYKKDYVNAETDEARALANVGAESIRRQYGSYLGGSDGAGYTPIQESRSVVSHSTSGIPDYTGAAEEAFSGYRKQYLREGERAYQNSLGEAAANTGGIASTAAVAAAQQAQNYYAAQAADKKAALYQQAFENWLADRDMTVSENSANATIAAKQAQTAAASTEAETAQTQQQYENAMSKWKAYGYITADISEILGLPVGTAYTEQAYDEWKQAYEEMKNGIYTGKTSYDSVNLGERQNSDTAANHATVQYGSKSGDVSTMQRYLTSLGFSCGSAGIDGKFGAATRQAVLSFQREYGLNPDGICGPLTWAALIEAAG